MFAVLQIESIKMMMEDIVKRTRFYLVTVFLLLSLPLLKGCISWEPGWKQASQAEVKGDAAALLVKAKTLEKDADSAEKVGQLVAALEDVIAVDPGNYEALNMLASNCMLIAYGYSQDTDDKEKYYMKAIGYSERGLYLNKDFRALVDKGEKTWEASRVLTKKEMYALYFWYLALGNWWTECLSAPAKLVNLAWPGRVKTVLENMTKIDPDFRRGCIDFSWGAYYAILPGYMGGDIDKADEYFNKALKTGPRMTQFWTGRARYLQTKKKDRQAFIADLERAKSIDPRNADELEYPWAVYHVANAKEMLADVDRYF
ncbi:MAG: hypothetical protein CVV44_06735 [Spirochaetae bacterium HGW-Spirochaetae-1]|nr:MAG: hypothetical protein CVV44_06735 [Spirochaetae bacterium HGW-Spirochaetae-1]